MRRSCPYCGTAVDVAKIRGTGESVPLETSPDSQSDAPLYKVVDTNPLTVVKAATGAIGWYLPDHRAECPGYGNGL